MGQKWGKSYNFQPLDLLIFFFLQFLSYVQIYLFCDMAVGVPQAT